MAFFLHSNAVPASALSTQTRVSPRTSQAPSRGGATRLRSLKDSSLKEAAISRMQENKEHKERREKRMRREKAFQELMEEKAFEWERESILERSYAMLFVSAFALWLIISNALS